MSDEEQAALDAEMDNIDEFNQEESSTSEDESEETEATEEESSEVGEEDRETEQVATPEAEESAKRSGIQDRINKITADKYRERERAEAAERKAAELEKKLIDLEKPDGLDGEIDMYDPENIGKLVDYKVQQNLRKAEIERTKTEQERARENQNREYAERVAKANIEDYGEKVAGLFDQLEKDGSTMPWEMVRTIQEDEKGPQLAYYLANNPNVAKNIISEHSRLGSLALVKLGEIKAGLSAPQKKKTTKAPDPIKTVKGGGGTISKDVSKKSMDEIMDDDRF